MRRGALVSQGPRGRDAVRGPAPHGLRDVADSGSSHLGLNPCSAVLRGLGQLFNPWMVCLLPSGDRDRIRLLLIVRRK